MYKIQYNTDLYEA